MNRVLFINGCVYLPGEHALKRTFYLFDMMLGNGYDVYFLTSDFNHYDKTKRNVNEFLLRYPQYKNHISFIAMAAYKRNISINRFASVWNFESCAIKWLKDHKDNYDMIYISLPTLHLAGSVRKFCEDNNIKIIIDVNDLWPEAFRIVFKNNILYRICTFPIKKLADKGYKSADCVIAVSDEYKNRALLYNQKAVTSKTVYLGAMIERFDSGVRRYAHQIEKPDNEFWIAYAGTIGASYDIKTIIDAAVYLYEHGYSQIRFKILGQGPDETYLRKYAKKVNASNVDFMGFLEYEKMAAYLFKSDLMVNCLKKRASQSVINKISDYFASGHPVINSCSSREMQDMIENNNVGLNYEAESVEEAVKVILQIYNNVHMAFEMGKRSRELALEKFDRRKTHLELQDMLIEM